AALLGVGDAIGLIVEQVDAHVRLQVGAVLLERDDGGVVGRDHQVEAFARAQVEERALPALVVRAERRDLMHGAHVARAARHLRGRAPRDVHLDTLAPERPDDGQEARVALAEDEHLPGGTGIAHAGARPRDRTSSNTASIACACPRMSKTGAAPVRAARAMAARRAGSFSSATMVVASASGSR